LEVRDYFIFLLFGKVAIYFLQTFSSHINIKWKLLQEMVECNLCLGFWVFTGLSFMFGVNLAPEFPIVSQILTGASSSLLVHLVSIGWNDKFGVTNILYDREE
jgi:hypothetical protein